MQPKSPPTTAAHVSGQYLTIAKPLNVVEGDVMIAFIRSQRADPDVGMGEYSWSRIGTEYVNGTISGSRVNGAYMRVATDDEPESYIFNTGSRAVGMITVWDSEDVAPLVTGFADSYKGDPSTPSGLETPAFAISERSIVFAWATGEALDGSDSAPNILPDFDPILHLQTGSGTSGSRTTIWVGSKIFEEAGTVPAHRFDWAGSVSAAGVQSVALSFISEPPPPPGLPITLANETPARLYSIQEGEKVAPVDMWPYRKGFNSVQEMLDTPGATWAHRGGSRNWPETSLHAYTQSVKRGFGALEVSFGRTSDGVWIGLHDNSINRTSGVSGLPNISAMTWAQVQEYSNVTNGGNQPYMRWEEIRDAYGESHILIMDPKNFAWDGNLVEFTAMCQELGPTRVVAKHAMPITDFAEHMGNAGFETWGYAYQSEYENGDVAANQGPWSLLGMEWNATTAWSDPGGILSYGKPVVAHIANSQSAYNTAIGKGASMVQCAEVLGINPVSRVGEWGQ